MAVRLVKLFSFEAARWLPTFPQKHKCRRMHGHSFRVDVVIQGEVESAKGYLIDYGEIKAAIEPIRTQLDHYCLNEIEGLENPTSEMLAAWIWRRVRSALPQLSWGTGDDTTTAGCHYQADKYRICKEQSFEAAVRLDCGPANGPRTRLHCHR